MASNQLVQSLLRGVDILSLVAQAEGGMRLNEIAEAAGLKAPTVHNLVRTLMARGFIEKENGSRYRLGPAVGELVEQQRNRTILRRAGEVMRQVAESHPKAVLVFVEKAGPEIMVRLRMSPDRPGILQKPAWQTYQPYGNASGLVFLAFLDQEARISLRQRYPFYEHGAHLWQTPDQLEAFLERVRNAGYAVPPFTGQALFRVSAPVFDKNQNLAAVFGAAVDAREMILKPEQDALVESVLAGAKAIGEETSS